MIVMLPLQNKQEIMLYVIGHLVIMIISELNL
jgi:hypothetical protein